MYDFWRKNFVKMKNNCFKEIFDRLLYYGMNYNPHWNRNFEAASPQAPDCTSQFVTWFNLVNILWKCMNHTESALWGAAAKQPRIVMFETCLRLQNAFWKFDSCSNPFRCPNFTRFYSPTQAVFQNRDNRKSSK